MPATTFSISVRRLPLARLGACLRELESAGVNELKVDLSDGSVAPGFALGYEIIEAIRESCALPVHVHLMADRPERFVDELARLGCATLTVPFEACIHAYRTFTQIHDAGMKSGASLNPGAALTKLEYVLPLLDRVLLPVDEGGAPDRDPPAASFERVRILRENIDYQETGAAILVEGDLRPKDAARFAVCGAHGIVVDRLDVLRIEPLDDSVRKYTAAVTKGVKTA